MFGEHLRDLRQRRGITQVGGDATWEMFTPGVAHAKASAEFFLLLPGGGSAIQSGEIIEDVRFIRAEMPNMAWATSTLGRAPVATAPGARARRAHRRSLARAAATAHAARAAAL